MDDDSVSLSKTSQLIFDHTSGDYYLAKIFDQDGNSGVEVIDPDYAKK